MRSWRIVVGPLALLLLVGTASGKPPTTVTCKDGTTAEAGRGACSHHGGVVKVPLAQRAEGATAKCNDGTYWHSTAHSGACLHNHGVAEWYDTNTR
jgi:uncharacterized protein DUF3761